MGGRCSCYLRNSLADQGLGDDEFRPSVVIGLEALECFENGDQIVPVDRYGFESVGLESRLRVLALGGFGRCVESNIVGVVNEDEIIEPEVTCEGAGFGGDALLKASVPCEANNVMVDNLMHGGIEL